MDRSKDGPDPLARAAADDPDLHLEGDDELETGAQREDAGAHRDEAGAGRDLAADRRDDVADQRDHAADQRDEVADRRDRVAEEAEEAEERASGGIPSDASDRSSLARKEAAIDRRRASSDRRSGARERLQAEVDRNIARSDRGASAKDRERWTDPSPTNNQNDAPVHLGLLGSFALWVEAEPVRVPINAQRLVSFVALHEGSLQRQHVAGSLWGETSDHRAAGSLRSALWRLAHPAYPLVEVDGAHLRLPSHVAVDVRASRAMARRILDDTQQLSETDADATLLCSDLLPDWTEDWVLIQRENHAQLRLRALESLCRRLTQMGRFGQAVQAGIHAVSGEPLRESAQRALIAAHIAEGNFAAALDRYHAFRDLLRAELDLDPSTEMQELVRDLHP